MNTSVLYLLINLFAVIAGLISIYKLWRRERLPREACLFSVLVMFLATILASLSIDLDWGERVIEMSFDSLRGVLGLSLGFVSTYWINKEKIPQKVAALIVVAPFMYSIAKISCVVAGCCAGRNGIPIQLIEVFSFAVLGGLFLAIYFKNGIKPILNIEIFAVLALKFILDFLRNTHEETALSRNQLIIAIYAILYLGIMLIFRSKNYDESRNTK